MKNCVIFVWKSYKDDVETLYTLLVQHIGTSKPRSKIIAKHNNSKNGRHFYLDLKGDFLTESHYQTKSKCAGKKISEATYSGENSNW